MVTEVIVASIAAVVSLVVATISLIAAITTNRLSAKTSASIELCTVVQQSLRGQAHASALADDTRLRLREIRAQLTDAQNLLRDSRGDRIVGRTLRKG